MFEIWWRGVETDIITTSDLRQDIAESGPIFHNLVEYYILLSHLSCFGKTPITARAPPAQ